ncbi:MAG: ParB/RepB/Spo0J family partition protein [Actinomycetota bacterium]
MARRGLGKGLGALIPSTKDNQQSDKFRVTEIPLTDITPNRNQPRQNFSDESLAELSDSIKEFGVIQPILVRNIDGQEERYEIIAGERRYRASKLAGLESIPCIISQDIDDMSSVEMALIENIHRDDLSPMELAFTFRQLIEEFRITHEELSRRVGKSRTAITNSLRLLTLPVEVQKLVDEQKISAGHARSLLALEDEQEKVRLAKIIAKRSLSVRDVENLVSEQKQKVKDSKKKSVLLPSKLPELSEKLSSYLDAPVKIKITQKKGKVEINFGSIKDLERIVGKIVK